MDAPVDALADSFFPAPPAAYRRYTSANLALAAELEAADAGATDEAWADRQRRVLGERAPDFDLRELVTAPDASWLAAEGGFESFGQRWPLEDPLPTLADSGVAQLYDAALDRREALRRLLQTLLLSYLQLVHSILQGPPSIVHHAADETTNGQRLIAHIRTTAINMHHLCNELRPVQARETLKSMLREQIDERKRRTDELRQCVGVKTDGTDERRSCASVSTLLESLRGKYATSGDDDAAMADAVSPLDGDWARLLKAVDAVGADEA